MRYLPIHKQIVPLATATYGDTFKLRIGLRQPNPTIHKCLYPAFPIDTPLVAP